MDKLEQKLREYNENNPVQISEAFLEKLMALEPRPAAKPPRRRYVLPIAAAAALALVIGGWFAWRHAATPEPAPAPVAIQSGPANAGAESQTAPSEPTAKPHTGTKEAKPQKENVSEESVTLTKPAASPMSGGDVPSGTNGGAASSSNDRPHVLPGESVTAKPGGTLPVLPAGETPGKPNDETTVNPDEEASAGHSGETQAKPNDETPVEPAIEPSKEPDDEKPDDPKPAESDDPPPAGPVDPNPQTPEDPDPPEVTPPEDDPPQDPTKPPEIGVVYLNEGNTETLILTLMSTGEIVEIDVTGLLPFYPSTLPQDPYSWDYPLYPAQQIKYNGECSAFGWQISYTLTRFDSGAAKAEVTDLNQIGQEVKGD